MTGFADAAAAIIAAASHRLDVAAQNVANATTTGYKRKIAFAEMVVRSGADKTSVSTMVERIGQEAGQLIASSNPLDLAIAGAGYFKVREGDQFLYTRQGQFKRGADGLVSNVTGQVLQSDNGDLVLDNDAIRIEPDGLVMSGDKTVGKISVFSPQGLTEFTAVDGVSFRSGGELQEVSRPVVRQGMLEASNVSYANEMITTMAAMREAESGAKLFQTYDDLIGRAISTLGSAGR